MKKLILLSLGAVLGTAVLLYSCKKEVDVVNQPTPIVAENHTGEEKAADCSCSASGTWSSCSITCPVRHGVCLANCSTASLFGISWFGSVATCTCGSAGAGKYIVPDGVFYDEINVDNLKGLELYTKDNPNFKDLHKELSELLRVIASGSGNLVSESQDFFDQFEYLSEDQRLLLKPVIEDLIRKNGRK